MIRGDSADQGVFTRAVAFVRSHGIESDANLGQLLNQPPANADADVLQRLRYMHESAAWVLMESAIADLPADLRWLFESGAVTVKQLAALHQALGVTTAGDLAAAVADHAVRDVEGLDGPGEEAIARALPDSSTGGSADHAGPGRHHGPADSRAASLDDRSDLGQPGRLAPSRAGYGRRHRDRRRDHQPGGRHRRADGAARRRSLSSSKRSTVMSAARARPGRRPSARTIKCGRRAAVR